MSLYDRDMSIPEPGWMMGDDIARGIDQPPEDRYMPDTEREVLAELRDELDAAVDIVEGGLKKLSMMSTEMDRANEGLLKAMRDFSGLLDDFHDFTVGDNWRDELEEIE